MPPQAPALLVVEDDPVSRRFFADALAHLDVALELAPDAASALALANGRTFVLALVDLGLPDRSGRDLPRLLRAHGHVGAVVALTADDSVRFDAILREAGFDGVAHKPLPATALRALVHGWLHRGPGFGSGTPASAAQARPDTDSARGLESPAGDARTLAGGAAGAAADAARAAMALWDDVRALAAANGRLDIVHALRQLLRDDLEAQRRDVVEAVRLGEPGRADAVLHRLRAACGFCGAVRLDRAVRELAGALVDGGDAAGALVEFEACCAAMLES